MKLIIEEHTEETVSETVGNVKVLTTLDMPDVSEIKDLDEFDEQVEKIQADYGHRDVISMFVAYGEGVSLDNASEILNIPPQKLESVTYTLRPLV